MTAALVAGIFTVGAISIIEGLIIFGRMQLFLTYVEQIAPALGVRLADKPSKSAPRTEAPAARIHWDETPEAAAWAAARPEDLPTEPQPIVQPETVPSHERVTVANVVRDDHAGRITDMELARIFADADNWLWDIKHARTEA